MHSDHNIPAKANRVLNVIILALLLILIRVWYLTVIQHDEQFLISRKPQRRSVIDKIERATIRDRFNIPLALNKIQYNAAICYAQLRQVPRISWKKDENGKLVRFQERVDYIKRLSALLGKELDIDPLSIEDLIYGKASLFPHTPFVIKDDLSEEQYFRLRMLEREWVGIQAQRNYKRFYPQGKVAADIIGHMGPISEREYHLIAQEMSILETYISERENGETPFLPKGFSSPVEVRERLKELQEKAYTINDLVGKMGIEGSFDEELRGYFGKKNYEVDVKGNFLRQLPGSRPSFSGQRILLTISSELQQFAESLLAQYETPTKKGSDQKESWIKGGAIVAMVPKTGEVLTLASYPRFDPNDFIPASDPQLKKQKLASVSHWLENEKYIGELWDGKRPFKHEAFKDKFFDESFDLTWERYLEGVLAKHCKAREAIERIPDLKTAVFFQEQVEQLLQLSGQNDAKLLFSVIYDSEGHSPSRFTYTAEQKSAILERLNQNREIYVSLKKKIDRFIADVTHNDDKLLVCDLCRMAVKREDFSDSLLNSVGKESLSTYRSFCQIANTAQSQIRQIIQELFHEIDFKEWRETHFQEYLRLKRKEEKANKRYTRPYTEYLDILEKNMFKEFWDKYRTVFLEAYLLGSSRINEPQIERYLSALGSASIEQFPKITPLKALLSALDYQDSIAFLKSMRSFDDLGRPLLGRYRHLRNKAGVQLEKHLAAGFYPLAGFGYGRSQAFRQSTPQGSVFKLVTAYEALQERYQDLVEKRRSLDHLNPLTLIDDLKGNKKTNFNSQVLGYSLDGTPITRLYKGGRLPRSSHPNIGKVDLIGAIEQSSNIYFSILAGEYMRDPNNLTEAARLFGFGEKTGIDLPGEIAGILPDDVAHNRTGLYSFAIGQHSLVATPLQTTAMLCAIANKGQLLKPKIVQLLAGKEISKEEQPLYSTDTFPYEKDLARVGIYFPLFTEIQAKEHLPYVYQPPTEVKRSLFMPDQVRNMLLEGMHQVVAGPRGTARPNIIRSLLENPKEMKDYIDLKHQFIGKTGTAEILYKHTLDVETEAQMKTHVWFGALSFSQDTKNHQPWEEPELAVVVYLRFGDAGKNAATLAAQMIKKWREICAKHGRSSHLPVSSEKTFRESSQNNQSSPADPL